jgi:hypothetical protein
VVLPEGDRAAGLPPESRRLLEDLQLALLQGRNIQQEQGKIAIGLSAPSGRR